MRAKGIDLSCLPRFKPALAATMNRLAAKHWSVALSDGHGNCSTLFIAFEYSGPALAMGLFIQFSGTFGQIEISTEAAILDVLSDAIVPEWRQEDIDFLAIDWRALVVLGSCLRDVKFEQSISEIKVSLDELSERRKHYRPALSGTASVGGVNFPFTMRFLKSTSDGSTIRLPANCGHQSAELDPGFRCSIRLPTRSLKFATYGHLGNGDIVITTHIGDGRFATLVDIEGLANYSAEIDLSGSVNFIVPRFNVARDHIMTNPAAIGPNDVHAKLDDDAIDNLPVTLDFLFRSRRITLAELRNIGSGVIMDLGIDLNAPIAISANGAAIGQGYLVQIGRHVGVQITEWPKSKDDRNA